MKREQIRIGMRVLFGESGGEQTLGKVVRRKRLTALVESLETRAGQPKGARWNVAFDLISLADDSQASRPEGSPLA